MKLHCKKASALIFMTLYNDLSLDLLMTKFLYMCDTDVNDSM